MDMPFVMRYPCIQLVLKKKIYGSCSDVQGVSNKILKTVLSDLFKLLEISKYGDTCIIKSQCLSKDPLMGTYHRYIFREVIQVVSQMLCDV
jgi:hypothetical protein